MSASDAEAAHVPDAVESAAQSRGGRPVNGGPPADVAAPDESQFRISERIAFADRTRVYERAEGDPLYRPLRIYALDPTASRLDGGIVSTKVPFEPLAPGPVGSLFAVDSTDATGGVWKNADLQDPSVLVRGGYVPSVSSPQFHQQMVYAVAMTTYASFKLALGRNISWPFPPSGPGNNRLRLRPHGAEEPNAWYDRSKGEVVFGYFTPQRSTTLARKGQGTIFTCLSHDVIAHELTHALLDGLRSHFFIPSHRDVMAFHEAFADLVALFQHFTFEDVVRAAIGASRGNLAAAKPIIKFAKEFGEGLEGADDALRTLSDAENEYKPSGEDNNDVLLTYESVLQRSKAPEAHDLGRVLSRGVFRAFVVVFRRRTRRFFQLASSGTGEMAPGDLPSTLVDVLVQEARRLAGQFLTICIRAIDYCPPVDVRFGDFLQAMITADRDVVPDDDLAYREAIINAFGERRIYGEGTAAMTEDALAWSGPQLAIAPEPQLGFGKMQFEGDPGKPVSAAEMRRQAVAVGRLAMRPGVDREFGIVSPNNPAFASGEYALPVVESVRTARRIGPDQQVVFDTVAEIVQTRRVTIPNGRSFLFYGGATVIIGATGRVRFVIRKRVDHEQRLEEQIEFMRSPEGRRVWEATATGLRPARDVAKRLCAVPGKPTHVDR